MEGRLVHSSITALSKGMRRARHAIAMPCHPITSVRVRQRTKEPTNNQPFELYIAVLQRS